MYVICVQFLCRYPFGDQMGSVFFYIHFGDTSQLQFFWCLGVKDRPGPLSCGPSCGDGQGVTCDLLAIEMTEQELLCLNWNRGVLKWRWPQIGPNHPSHGWPDDLVLETMVTTWGSPPAAPSQNRSLHVERDGVEKLAGCWSLLESESLKGRGRGIFVLLVLESCVY